VDWANAITSVATVATAIIAWRAIEPARQGIQVAIDSLAESRKARRVDLVLEVSGRYGSAEMLESLAYLRHRRDRHPTVQAMADAYVAECRACAPGTVADWHKHRRQVSKLFVALHALCVSGVLEEAVLAKTLQRSAFEAYLDVVAPLDLAHNSGVLGRDDYDSSVQQFFNGFQKRHFLSVAGRPTMQ
jgi:hypothetical protein